MSEKIEVSVVVPMYNAEKTIDRCLRSLEAAVAADTMEVIIIDDGSKDKSPDIAGEYAAHNKGWNVYSYSNGGLSKARNRGIEHATGKYIYFIDSDDYVDTDYICKLYERAEETDADVVYAGFSEERDGCSSVIERTVLDHQEILSGRDWIKRRLDKGDWYNQVWCGLYKRDFLLENNVLFLDDVRKYEDIIFSNLNIIHARRVSTVSDYGYHYVIGNNTLIHNGGAQETEIEDIIAVLNRYIGLMEQEPDAKSIMGRVCFEIVSMICYYIGEANSLFKKRYYNQIRTDKVLRVLKKSITNKKEFLKYYIFKYVPGLYYPLVKR